MSVSDVQTAIQTAIDGAGSGDAVTVTGTKTGADDMVTLTIPAGVRVVWKATYAGADWDNNNLIQVNGSPGGVFEVAAGANISVTGEWCAAVAFSGGI